MPRRPDAARPPPTSPPLIARTPPRPLRVSLSAMLALASLLAAGLAQAVDGVREINQTQALAGGVTPGDTPGFPVTLSEPGSYRLTSPLVVSSSAADGIQISSDDITIDLNGFAITGPVACTGSGTSVSCGAGSGIGIKRDSLEVGTVVHDGTVSGFGGGGIVVGALNPGFGSENRIEDVRVVRNGGDGVQGGLETIVARVQAIGNDGDGIDLSRRGRVLDSVATGNAANGIVVSAAGVVSGCTASENGIDGMSLGAGAAAFDSAARSNGVIGIDAGGTSIVRGNVADGNGTAQLDQFSGGYSGNVLGPDNYVTGSGVNAGGNVCGIALCP